MTAVQQRSTIIITFQNLTTEIKHFFNLNGGWGMGDGEKLLLKKNSDSIKWIPNLLTFSIGLQQLTWFSPGFIDILVLGHSREWRG